MGLMLDSKSGKKWQWIASQYRWLALVKPMKLSIASFYADIPVDMTIKQMKYRKELFYVANRKIEMWIPDSVPRDKTEEYIFKHVFNRNFLKALKQV
jgi:hypothetical protein